MNTEYAIGVKRLGEGHTVDFICSYQDHLTALKAVNKLNCTKGLKTGDLYVMEEVQK